MLELFALFSFAHAFIIRILGWSETNSHHGPFQSQTESLKRIYRNEEGEVSRIYTRPVVLQDRIRQLFSGMYIIDGETREWHVNALRAEVWECPRCLSPWVAIVLVTPVMLLMGKWKQIPLMIAAVAGGGYFVYSLTEYFWETISMLVVEAEEEE